MSDRMTVIRFVSADDPHNYLHRDVAEGEVLYRFYGATYGCIDYDGGGIAITEDPKGGNPFAEFPSDALRCEPS